MVENNLYRQLFDEFKDDIDFKVTGVITDITEEICETMDKKDLNRANLATILETSKAAVTKMLNGSTNFTLKRLVKIAVALEKDLNISFKEPKTISKFVFKPGTLPSYAKIDASSRSSSRLFSGSLSDPLDIDQSEDKNKDSELAIAA